MQQQNSQAKTIIKVTILFLSIAILGLCVYHLVTVKREIDYSYVIRAFEQSAYPPEEWLQDCSHLAAPLTVDDECSGFYINVDKQDYLVVLLTYTDYETTWRELMSLRRFNRIMNDGHYMGFSHRTLLVAIFPTNYSLLDDLKILVREAN